MPYYREYFLNGTLPISMSTYDKNGAIVPGETMNGTIVTDDVLMTSFRSRPHPRALSSIEIPDFTADPYASFLDTISEKNYHDRLRERGLKTQGAPDMGHSFDLRRYGARCDMGNAVYTRGGDPTFANYRRQVIQNWYPYSDGVGRIKPTDVGSGDLDAWAQKAYTRSAPSAAVFDAATFLGELREGLPRLALESVKDPSRFFKNVGSDYLNVEFGWLPFISDLQNAGRALSRATEQLSRQGERVHRTYSSPLVSSNSSIAFSPKTQIGSVLGQAPDQSVKDLIIGTGSSSDGVSVPNMGAGTTLRTFQQDRWFEGEFTSFYPLGFDPTNYFDRLSQLVNVKMTPATLWELTPWSWLVDWLVDIQSSIQSNLTAANDLLVMHYGYAMEHSIERRLSWWNSPPAVIGSGSSRATWNGPPQGSIIVTNERKRRIRANPYGFQAKSLSALNVHQGSILGALALTKGSR